jgi:asparagine N-glycosylation enzyme membrane subunit Stt3
VAPRPRLLLLVAVGLVVLAAALLGVGFALPSTPAVGAAVGVALSAVLVLLGRTGR